jgi:hypothetical protein
MLTLYDKSEEDSMNKNYLLKLVSELLTNMFIINLNYIVPLEELSLEEVEKIIAEDPFHKHELAEFTITQFLTSQYHPELKNLLDT